MKEVSLRIYFKNGRKLLEKEEISVSSKEADRVIDWFKNADESLNEKVKIIGSNGTDVFIVKYEEIKSIKKYSADYSIDGD